MPLDALPRHRVRMLTHHKHAPVMPPRWQAVTETGQYGLTMRFFAPNTPCTLPHHDAFVCPRLRSPSWL